MLSIDIILYLRRTAKTMNIFSKLPVQPMEYVAPNEHSRSSAITLGNARVDSISALASGRRSRKLMILESPN